jgi:hypothetical protein
MSADIVKAISANPIKNGSMILNKPLKAYSDGPLAYNAYVDNKPVITDIDDKYTDRFDDLNYYQN